MPKQHIRIQVLLEHAEVEVVRLLAAAEGKSLSRTCAELIEEGLPKKMDRIGAAIQRLEQWSAIDYVTSPHRLESPRDESKRDHTPRRYVEITE